MEIPREWTLDESDLELITDARCVGNWPYDIHFLFAKSIGISAWFDVSWNLEVT